MSYSVCIYAIYYTFIFVCESTNNRYSCACEIMYAIVVQIIYRMAGNFGGEFILADWRF